MAGYAGQAHDTAAGQVRTGAVGFVGFRKSPQYVIESPLKVALLVINTERFTNKKVMKSGNK